MCQEELPADATCLIYLARTDTFDLAADCLSRILVAPAVWREAVDAGERLGYRDAIHIRRAYEGGFILRANLDHRANVVAGHLATTWRIGQGESETLALGSEIGRAIIDDGRAARVAEAVGIEPVSTLFLPVLGAMRGLSAERAVSFARALAVVMTARAETLVAIEEFIRRRT